MLIFTANYLLFSINYCLACKLLYLMCITYTVHCKLLELIPIQKQNPPTLPLIGKKDSDSEHVSDLESFIFSYKNTINSNTMNL